MIKIRSEHDGQPYTLVNTHLETQGLAPLQAGQAAELIGVITAGINETTFVLGDLNSDAAAGPGAPSWTPTYGNMLAAGFTDVWPRGKKNSPTGFTCCNAKDLMNGPGALSERIDFILVRGIPLNESGGLVGSVHSDILGEESGDRTTAGLWPSDHAGLVSAMSFPSGLLADGN